MMSGPVLPVVRRVMEITGTDLALPLASDRNEAIARLRSANSA
ncbi:hypothetical protein ABT127_29860 [Streptomyces sp. NPDC001904]